LKIPLCGGSNIEHAAVFMNIAAAIFYRGRITAAVCGLPLRFAQTEAVAVAAAKFNVHTF
jgi:hypothetical protein